MLIVILVSIIRLNVICGDCHFAQYIFNLNILMLAVILQSAFRFRVIVMSVILISAIYHSHSTVSSC